ncbi:hypothetical protein K1719_035444 [Acacia pycnantha]|nr:hypothetical protein K1719_035444 [Acacia pycnantha]
MKNPFFINWVHFSTNPSETSPINTPLVLLQRGQIPTLVVSSADLTKQVLKTHDVDFANRFQNAAARIIFFGCNDVAFSNYGESWRQKRKLCVLELLSSKRVRSFQFIRDDEIQDLISNIRKSCCVNISEMLSAASNNIICRCILGQKFETEESSGFGNLARRELTEALHEILVESSNFALWHKIERDVGGSYVADYIETMESN